MTVLVGTGEGQASVEMVSADTSRGISATSLHIGRVNITVSVHMYMYNVVVGTVDAAIVVITAYNATLKTLYCY